MSFPRENPVLAKPATATNFFDYLNLLLQLIKNSRVGVTIWPGEKDAAALMSYTIQKAKDRKFCYHGVSDYMEANCDFAHGGDVQLLWLHPSAGAEGYADQPDCPMSIQHSLHWI